MPLDLISLRRDFHRNPETAYEEKRTARRIFDELSSIGLTPAYYTETGIVVEIEGSKKEPITAIRVDIDALPIEENSNVAFSSLVPGKMHACGHDIHTVIGMGIAEKCLSRKSEILGTVRILFQPAEEVLEGAKKMISAGVLIGVSSIFGFHNKPEIPVGRVAFREGSLMAASARFEIIIEGQGGHGAAPHLTKDPIIASAGITLGIQTAVSRKNNPLDPVVVSICEINGGNTYNVIPQLVRMMGTVRYLSPSAGKAIPNILSEIIENIARGYGCTAKFKYEELVGPLVNSITSTLIAQGAAQRILGAESVLVADPIMASEDFSDYLKYVPGCYFWLGSNGRHGFHNPAYKVDEGCIEVGVDVLTEIAIESLSNLSQL